jgi:pimeloyl-ACP methyl ester carboxylesterase
MSLRTIVVGSVTAFTVASFLLISAEAHAQTKMPVPKFSFVQTSGVKLRIAEMGQDPLVLLLHGWPESWYSWRHQLPALAKAGYRAVAPDLRGYGESDKPPRVEDYDIVQLTADAAGLVEALGEKDAVLVGHDWGAVIAWQAMLLHPERFRALASQEDCPIG